METNQDNIRSGQGYRFILADLFSSAMCNRHAEIYIQWFCCNHPSRDHICASLRRQCLQERIACSPYKDKPVQ